MSKTIWDLRDFTLEPWGWVGSPDRKYCHSSDPEICWQIVLLYVWQYWPEWNQSNQEICLLLHEPSAFYSSQHCTVSRKDSVKCHGLWSLSPLHSQNFLQLCHLSIIETRHLKLEQVFICMFVLMFISTYKYLIRTCVLKALLGEEIDY